MKRRNYFFKCLFTTLIFFVFTLTIGSIATLSTFAETTINPLNISYCNLSFENEVHLLYAIKEEDKNVQLLVWEEVQEEYMYGTQTASLSPLSAQADINGELYTVFEYNGLSAKQMTDNVYVRAYLSTTEEYGDVYKYSILQYAYNKIGKTDTPSTNEKFVNMLNKMLEYGAATQEYQGYKTDALATDDFSQIILTDGTLPDGFKKGLYKVGSSVTISAPSTNADGEEFKNWIDKENTIIADTAEYVLTVGEGNNTYTPKYAEYVQGSQGLAYTLSEDKTYYIVSGIGTCTDTDIIIPSTYDTKPVTTIGGSAFYNCRSITSITIPDNVTSIDNMAFAYCSTTSNLSITFGENSKLSSIGNFVFSGCRIESIEIPDSVTSIGHQAFKNCNILKSITFSENSKLSSIGNSAFSGCSSLTSITLPNNVTFIGTNIFENCTSLTSITIPDSIASIGYCAFSGCSSLTSITFGEESKLLSIGESAFKNCTNLSEIVIPDSVTSIGNGAFYACYHLSEIIIPESVTNIEMAPFTLCNRLINITVDENNQYYKDINGNLYTKDEKTLIQYPKGKTETIFEIPDSVTSIEYQAFYGSNLNEIVIPDSVTNIEVYAFSHCINLSAIVIPDSVISISECTFSHCTSLTSITIPDGVTSIGGSAFSDCRNLTSITIPDSVTSIGAGAFGGV